MSDQRGEPDEHGIDALRAVLGRRIPGGHIERILPDEKLVRQLILASGGHLRMLLGLTMEVITQAEALPVDEATVTSSIAQVRSGLLPISDDERALLRQVAADHKLPLSTQEKWDVAADLLDQRLVLGYRNGEDWYDAHPLLRDEIADAGQSE